MINKHNLHHHLFLFSTLLFLWLLLTSSLAMDELLAGILVASIVSLISAPYLDIFNGVRYTPMAVVAVLRYLGYFFVALIRANFDMAGRVLSPSLPISPAVVEVQTRLKSRLGQMLLANSITLTPGTLSVDLNNDRILVHWIAAPEGISLEQATHDIASGFEQHISGFLE
ncbi:MAG: Na+/H+ antiporter subunit E [Gammaproteobacteria bacterium]|nr:Na+/H+ antiporter subunit E [Gammaproteobacteria bacterium]MBL7000489.1 Na+/H+ antiporter subunit E [Gammaproteobacteria bacterium]